MNRTDLKNKKLMKRLNTDKIRENIIMSDYYNILINPNILSNKNNYFVNNEFAYKSNVLAKLTNKNFNVSKILKYLDMSKYLIRENDKYNLSQYILIGTAKTTFGNLKIFLTDILINVNNNDYIFLNPSTTNNITLNISENNSNINVYFNDKINLENILITKNDKIDNYIVKFHCVKTKPNEKSTMKLYYDEITRIATYIYDIGGG